MSKRKLDQISGHDPWEIEAAALAEHLKLDQATARDVVVIRWMQRGDDRPLAAALRDGPLSGAVLSQLLKMVDEGQFTAKRKRGNRYEYIAYALAGLPRKSDEAIQALAKDFNISDEAIRRAIKRRPKPTT